jgi:hypothetical protein
MKLFLWWLGKGLQVLALFQVAAALFVGFETQDPTLELKLLVGGGMEFLLGYFLVASTGTQTS